MNRYCYLLTFTLPSAGYIVQSSECEVLLGKKSKCISSDMDSKPIVGTPGMRLTGSYQAGFVGGKRH